jgi:hypothetical protein
MVEDKKKYFLSANIYKYNCMTEKKLIAANKYKYNFMATKYLVISISRKQLQILLYVSNYKYNCLTIGNIDIDI